MPNNVYIGARYVPKLDGDWSASKNYEPLTVVSYNNSSYTSKRDVPAGTLPTDQNYWMLTGNYNGQISHLQNEINQLQVDVKSLLGSLVIFMPNTETSIPSSANGASTVFITKDKHVIMFDTGRDTDYTAIKNELHKNDIDHIDYFILSHYHGDHWYNLSALINDNYIDDSTVVYLQRETSAVSGWDAYYTIIRGLLSNNTIITPDSNTPLIVDDLTFNFFNCDAADFTYYETQGYTNGNIYSLFAYVTSGNFKLLMCGDIEPNAISYQLQQDNFSKCNIINMPHHGIGGNNTTFEMLLLSHPDAAVIEVGAAAEYTYNNYHDVGVSYNHSKSVAYLNALNIPAYLTGYGAQYLNISDGDYQILGDLKQVNSYQTQWVDIDMYVDDTYVGVGYGTALKPFNSIEEALAFINNMGNTKLIRINVVGTYNHSDAHVVITDQQHYIQIIGTKTGSTYNVTVNRFDVMKTKCFINHVKIACDDDYGVRARLGSEVYLDDIDISGDTTGITSNYGGAAIYNESSKVVIETATINNRNIVFYAAQDGDIFAKTVTGSGNTNLISGLNGGDINIGTADILFTTFCIQRENEYPPCSNARLGFVRAYDAFGPFNAFTSYHTAAETDVIDLSPRIYNYRLFRIMCSDGTIYQVEKIGNSNLTSPVKVQNDFGTPDASLAVSVSGKTLSITHSSLVRIVAM